jgi:hypothetical protein
MPLDKPLESITEADLQALKSDKVSEGKSIEYKISLPSESYDDKKEYLADVSSFANAAGGHLIFGIEENEGIPVKVCGLQGIDPDAEILRLENLLRDGIEPRIPGVAMWPVPLTAGVAIIIRVPRSWNQPHIVKLQKHWRFYSRNSAGKHPLDVSELREHFLLSGTTAERIRLFRTDRLGKIVAAETPVILAEGAKTALHIIPFGAFDPTSGTDMASLESDVWKFRPIGVPQVDGWRYNLDGILAYGHYLDPPSPRSYLQIFRNGCIEAVETSLLRIPEGSPSVIESGAYENELIVALSRFLSIQQRLGIEPPLFVMISMLGVRGYCVKPARSDDIDPFWWLDRAKPIDRDVLILPEIVVDNFEVDSAETMRPIFDAIWNASGWSRSLNYDDEGKWLDKRS